MTRNLLVEAKSPYLLQHADNPVHWRPWGEAALREAKTDDKPLLVSVGYAACHWCHVMAHESFEDAETAAMMNRLFVNVKVDREERPDVDQALMTTLQALGEPGGWPLTMFLLPDGRPFWGGTYFPREPRWGRPSFRQVLQAISAAYQARDPALLGNADALAAALIGTAPDPATPVARISPDQSIATILGLLDIDRGGLRGAPKFPNAPVFALLWQLGCGHENERARDGVLRLLEAMSLGGIHDHLGGGFARYSTDADWLVPHFEKMLYDNAQLLDLLARAVSSRPDPWLAECATALVDWLRREMLVGGAFAAAIDADSEGEEGRFYVWDSPEIAEHLGPALFDRFSEAFELQAEGNWEGRTVLRRLKRPAGGRSEPAISEARSALLARRDGRPRPLRDDKVLADWNGLAIAALVRAAIVFDRGDWLDLAREVADALERKLATGDGRIGHAWRDGVVMAPGFLADQAMSAAGLLALHEATGEPGDLARAVERVDAALRWFTDDRGRLCTTARDLGDRTFPPMSSVQDGPLPSGSGMLALVAARLAVLSDQAVWADIVRPLLADAASFGANAPLVAPTLLAAADTLEEGLRVEITGRRDDDRTRALWHEALRSADPRVVVRPPAIAGDPMATATVCGRGVCSLPVTTPEGLRSLIAERGRRA